MSIEVNRRWAAHINIELARVGAHEQIVSEARGRSVAIIRRDDGIVRPGSMALVALVQLPDGAGVDAAWGALSSIPDVDATVERWSQEEAAASHGEVFATSETPDTHTVDLGCAIVSHAGSAAGCGLCHPAPAPETPAPGAMRPETRRRIEDAVMATPLPLSHPVGLSCLIMAEGALRNAERATEDAVECAEHILRAIAYLVRRLELEAPAPEQGRDEPR